MHNYGSLIAVPVYDEMEQQEDNHSYNNIKQVENKKEDDFTTKILVVKILDKLTELSTKMTNIERHMLQQLSNQLQPQQLEHQQQQQKQSDDAVYLGRGLDK